MQTLQLGNTDLRTTRLGLGTWAIGGGNWQHGWGPQNDNESIRTIHRALDHGINWIDTAAVYGLGHAEEVIARALAGRSDRPYLFTKCALVWDSNRTFFSCLKRESVRREVENSLRRLKVDVIDLYQIHWPYPEEDIEEGWRTMAEIQAEGKVRYIGVSNFNTEQMQRAQLIAPIASLQPPYSLINQSIEDEILPFCAQHKIGVIVYSPMASGLLSGTFSAERVTNLPDNDWRRHNAEFQQPRLSQNMEIVALLRKIGSRYGRSPGEAAIAWTLRHPTVTAAIVGGRHPGQVDQFIEASTLCFSDDDLSEIDQLLAHKLQHVRI